MSCSTRPTRRWSRCSPGSSPDRRRAAQRAAALAAGLAFAWFAPSAEAVAWIAARFDGMALFWMLVAACAFMASRAWRDRYGLASLAATVLAFMSKESAAIGPALIVALAWVKRPDGRRPAARRRARARRRVALARDRGGVFRVPDVDLRRPLPLLSGDLAGPCAPVRKVARRAARERRLVAARAARSRCRAAFTPSPALLLGVAAVSAGLRDRARGARARRHRAGVPRGARAAVLALGLVGDRRRGARAVRARCDRGAGGRAAAALAGRAGCGARRGSSPSCCSAAGCC